MNDSAKKYPQKLKIEQELKRQRYGAAYCKTYPFSDTIQHRKWICLTVGRAVSLPFQFLLYLQFLWVFFCRIVHGFGKFQALLSISPFTPHSQLPMGRLSATLRSFFLLVCESLSAKA